MSNGSLMRCMPLVAWASKLEPAQLRLAIEADVSMTHPSEVVKSAIFLYALAIQKLLHGTGDRKKLAVNAYQTALSYAQNELNNDEKGEPHLCL